MRRILKKHSEKSAPISIKVPQLFGTISSGDVERPCNWMLDSFIKQVRETVWKTSDNLLSRMVQNTSFVVYICCSLFHTESVARDNVYVRPLVIPLLDRLLTSHAAGFHFS